MKRILAALLALALICMLAGCLSVDEGYEAALKQNTIPGAAAQDEPQAEDGQKPGDEPQTEDEEKPEDEPQTETPTEVSAPSVEWPQGVPSPAEYHTRISELWESGDSFKAQYLVSTEQLTKWEKLLSDAGYTANGVTANGWKVSWVKYSQSSADGVDYRVALEVTRVVEAPEPPASDWPADFAVFPEYNGDGRYTVSITSSPNGYKQLSLTSENETQAGLARYTDLLVQNGFASADGGVYTKTLNDTLYTVKTAGAWVDTSTARITLEVSVATAA